MKKFTILSTFVMLLMNADLEAQATGEASVATVKTAKENHWQNWTFAGSAVLTAATAIFIVSMNDGKKVQSTSQ